MGTYPVTFDVAARPALWSRAQVAIRLLTLLILAILGVRLGWLFVLAYFALPLIAAVVLSRRGATGYFSDTAPGVEQAVAWLLGLFSYMAFLTDDLPRLREPGVRFEVQRTGEPTVGSALWRI